MDKYKNKNIILIAVSAFLGIILFNHYNFKYEDWMDHMAMILMVGVIIFNEVRSQRNFSGLDLVSLREEVHGLNSQQQLLAKDLEYKASREEFMSFQLEVQSSINEMTQFLNSISVEEAPEQYEEEKPKTKKSKR